MRGRTILILLVVLAVLGATATLFETSRRKATRSSGKPLFPGLKTESVDGLRFDDGMEGVKVDLEKRGDEWVVVSEGGHRAEQKLVTDIIDKLPKFPADEVVSTNPSRHSLFKVDSTGIEVWVKQKGKEIGHFYVGKPGPDFLSTYVRAAGSDNVLLVPEYLPSLFQRGDTWREKTIFALKPDDVRKYEYVSPSHGRLSVSKQEDGSWRMTEPDTGRVEAAKLSGALRAITSLKAIGFADTTSAAAAGVEPDTTHIAVTTADGVVHTLYCGIPTAANRFLVRKNDDRQIFTLPRGHISTLMMRPSGLLSAPPSP